MGNTVVLRWLTANGCEWDENTIVQCGGAGRAPRGVAVGADRRVRVGPGRMPEGGALGERNSRVDRGAASLMKAVVEMHTRRACEVSAARDALCGKNTLGAVQIIL